LELGELEKEWWDTGMMVREVEGEWERAGRGWRKGKAYFVREFVLMLQGIVDSIWHPNC
jgi:hypothetical protein